MIKRLLHGILLLAIVTSLFTLSQSSNAQNDAQFFPETNHWIRSPFLEAWRNTPDAMTVIGLPISSPFMEESFSNPGEYYRVQYFERSVLEEHPENLGVDGNKYYILGRLMGNLLAQGRESEPPFQPVADPGDGTWHEPTQHTLTNNPAPFRTFFEQNGGVSVFGYPISEQFQEVNQASGEKHWVQYFERQRLEWHPQQSPEYQVMLGLLGSEYRDANHVGNSAFDPESSDPSVEPVSNPYPIPSQPTPTPTPMARTKPLIHGYNATLYGEMEPWQDRQRVLQMSKDSGVYWVRQQIAWRDMQDAQREIHWGELDDIVEDVNDAGMKILLSVVQSPSWATPNGSHGLPSREHFGTFAHFMGSMAQRYQGKVQAYEIWNEQNRACENGGDCQTAGGIGGQVANSDYYVDMLRTVYDAIKASDPNAIVVSGAPTSTETNRPDIAISDVTYVKQMLNNPNFRADAIGMHPGGQNNPPDTFWPDNPGPEPWQNSREFYFRRIEDIRQAVVDAGKSDMPIWVTEFGWATANTTPGYEYGNMISLDTQAEWIARAFTIARNDYPWVEAMFLWNLNFAVSWGGAHGDPTHEQASFGVLNPDWTPRPAWYAIRDLPKY